MFRIVSNSAARIIVAAAAMVSLSAVTVASVAGAATVTASFTPSSMTAAGGLLTVNYTMPTGVKSCAISVAPPGPIVPTCVVTAGDQHATFLVPPNTGGSTQTYAFTLSGVFSGGSNIGGSSFSTSQNVTVSPSASNTYVALGDSLASGDGNGGSGWVDYSGAASGTGTANSTCHRSSSAYPKLVSSWLAATPSLLLPSLNLSFVSCAGATTANLWSGSPALKAGLTGGGENNFDNGESPQLNDTAELANARVVTLSVGGDDVRYQAIVDACLAVSLGETPASFALAKIVAPGIGLSTLAFYRQGKAVCSKTSTAPAVKNLTSNIQKLQAVLVSTFQRVQTEAPKAHIFVTGYPDLLPKTPSAANIRNGCGGISGSLLPFISGIAPSLNTVVQKAAASAGVTFVDPNAGANSFLGTGGHTLCGANSWFFGLNTSSHGTDNLGTFLPTSVGQQHLALATEASIDAVITAANAQSKAVESVVSDGHGYCAFVQSGAVKCWGRGVAGELGNGKFYPTGNQGSAIPVTVVSTSGTGTLTDVASIASNGSGFGEGYCALLTSGGVDCWGYGGNGQLGNGHTYSGSSAGSAVPVPVVGTNGTGTLSGVSSLASDGGGYCAVLTSGGVDCWGEGQVGELGDGKSVLSNIPVPVVDVNGSGTLTGVASVTSDGTTSGEGYCALLTSGGVDCWGFGASGQLGNGSALPTGTQSSSIPVTVVDITGSGSLSGVTSLVSDGGGYCAVLTTGGVDCWGQGQDGELGNGVSTETATPTPVSSRTGSGTLTGVVSVASADNGDGYCALLVSGGVDCWGWGASGQLGNGHFYPWGNQGSSIPVAVVGATGFGTLGGVSSLASDGTGYCATLTSGGVNCWGAGFWGQTGTGAESYSDTPQNVVAVSGSGNLGGVTSVVSGTEGYCALLASGDLNCWGRGLNGELGNGVFYTSGYTGSATPVLVE